MLEVAGPGGSLVHGAGAGGVPDLGQVPQPGPGVVAFGTTFWVAAGLIALAVVPALLLPRSRRGG